MEVDDALSSDSDDMQRDGSDDESEDETEGRDEEEDARVLQQLSQDVESNPYAYDSHIKLIQHAKVCGDLEVLRQARQRASELFPLTEELWKAWIKDETTLIDNEKVEEHEKIKKLYERSLEDYLSVDLWLDYAMFCLQDVSSNEALQPVRDVFERALTAAGIHVTKGSVLWNSYLEIEKGFLKSLLSTGEQNEARQLAAKKQIQRVKDLYKRQFSVPLLGMDAEYAEFSSFIGEDPDKETQFAYEKAKAKLEEILPFEKDLENADDNSQYKVFMSYIDYELSAKEPIRVLNLYERALTVYCLSADLWIRYLEFLDKQLKQEILSISAHERSIRNLPWVFELWPSYMRALELYGHDQQDIGALFSRAISTACSLPTHFVELWMSFLCFLKRRLSIKTSDPALLQAKLAEAAADVKTKEVDVEDRILRFWAWIEAETFCDVNKGREIWDRLMKNHQRESSYWLEYFHFERKFGNPESCRKLLKKALLRNLDDVDKVAEMWMHLEEETGSLDDWMEAYHLCRSSLKKLHERLSKNASHLNENIVSRKKTFREKDEPKGGKKQGDRPVRTEKRKKSDAVNVDKHMDSDGFKIPEIPVSPVPKRSKLAAAPSGVESLPSGISVSPVLPERDRKERTIFVSNLNYQTSEETVYNFFHSLGEIKDIRLAKDVRGRSRGFGFVEFFRPDVAKEALEMDRKEMDGSEGHEEKKLFIRGLHMKVTKEDVAALFKQYDGLQDVRIVTHKNGTSKGIAYVEFNSPNTARRALQEMDGKEIFGKPMNIAISNPPAKPTGATKSVKPSDESFRQMQRKSRSNVNLLPRAVSLKPSTSSAPETKPEGDTANAAAANGQKSNADFRAALLKR
ncbi:squamous cell carcinoma antigen recognized by T-cells 3-like isoform X2 [Paramacrobiotus metropolitanus]|uniref:squamous cell carcinoma antigen recognized by T-cells 3-like isoform X2 n=1 Tax=Paramacrobiotus metropolitanus TaxID=2943436 RepID=UPI0024455E9D|nr:squamous cell carcinoma antigen recognized by T-cells 3-like isoform X2 [Paramacrobiotus metropolitanus]